MRWLALAVLIYAVPVYAESPSPRIAALAAKQTTEDAFWKQVATTGTPLVEDVKDPKGKLLVTFVYRAKPGVKAVAAYGTPNPALGGHVQLERIGQTNTFAWSTLVDARARFTYWFGPGDDFGPPSGMGDVERREALWQADPQNKRRYGVFQSIAELPKAPPQPWLVPKRETKPGDVLIHTVKSKALANERPVAVYTPPGFAKTGPKYPLVVMFDGGANVVSLGLPIVLDELIAAKQIPPVVVLMVGNADRSKELPANEKFADFVALDLVPWARATYHATNDPQRTVISGISFGGIAAAYAAMRHPAVYGNVLSQSGSYWWAPDDDAEGELHAREYAARPKLPLRWWMECGVFEVGSPKPASTQLGGNRHMRDILRAKGYEVSYREYAGGHEYISWRGSIADGLIALVAKPPKLAKAAASTAKPGGIEVDAGKKMIMHVVQRGALLDGGAGMVAKLKTFDAALIGEQEVNEAGYTLLELGHAREAIPLLQWNVERFPKSQNTYDSLAQAYYDIGDREKALANYKRSFELEPKNLNAKKMIELLR